MAIDKDGNYYFDEAVFNRIHAEGALARAIENFEKDPYKDPGPRVIAIENENGEMEYKKLSLQNNTVGKDGTNYRTTVRVEDSTKEEYDKYREKHPILTGGLDMKEGESVGDALDRHGKVLADTPLGSVISDKKDIIVIDEDVSSPDGGIDFDKLREALPKQAPVQADADHASSDLTAVERALESAALTSYINERLSGAAFDGNVDVQATSLRLPTEIPAQLRVPTEELNTLVAKLDMR